MKINSPIANVIFFSGSRPFHVHSKWNFNTHRSLQGVREKEMLFLSDQREMQVNVRRERESDGWRIALKEKTGKINHM